MAFKRAAQVFSSLTLPIKLRRSWHQENLKRFWRWQRTVVMIFPGHLLHTCFRENCSAECPGSSPRIEETIVLLLPWIKNTYTYMKSWYTYWGSKQKAKVNPFWATWSRPVSGILSWPHTRTMKYVWLFLFLDVFNILFGHAGNLWLDVYCFWDKGPDSVFDGSDANKYLHIYIYTYTYTIIYIYIEIEIYWACLVYLDVVYAIYAGDIICRVNLRNSFLDEMTKARLRTFQSAWRSQPKPTFKSLGSGDFCVDGHTQKHNCQAGTQVALLTGSNPPEACEHNFRERLLDERSLRSTPGIPQPLEFGSQMAHPRMYSVAWFPKPRTRGELYRHSQCRNRAI